MGQSFAKWPTRRIRQLAMPALVTSNITFVALSALDTISRTRLRAFRCFVLRRSVGSEQTVVIRGGTRGGTKNLPAIAACELVVTGLRAVTDAVSHAVAVEALHLGTFVA